MSTPSLLFSFDNIRGYLTEKKDLSLLLGGKSEDWKIKEVGDGNINYVWVIEGEKGGLVAKQAAPYIRIAPTWELTINRVFWEYNALNLEGKLCPEHVPKVFEYDAERASIVMQYLSPHIILRKGLMDAVVYPNLAKHMSDFLAKTLFHTSDLYLKAEEKRKIQKIYVNNDLIHLTENVIFTEPYITHKNNHWTQKKILEDEIVSIQSDEELKLQVQLLKDKFMNYTQALLHGDLHTGSIMVTAEETYVIDPEFAYVGPMGFDIGALIGNLILSYISQDGRAKEDEVDKNRGNYKVWLLEQINDLWTLFEKKFLALWDSEHKGEGFSLSTEKNRNKAQQVYMRQLFVDTLGFAGCKMIRRIIGIAHVADLETIKNEEIRAPLEVKVLKFGKMLIMQPENFKTIQDVTNQLSKQ